MRERETKAAIKTYQDTHGLYLKRKYEQQTRADFKRLQPDEYQRYENLKAKQKEQEQAKAKGMTPQEYREHQQKKNKHRGPSLGM